MLDARGIEESQEDVVWIGIDAMGGDFGPKPVVGGAVTAAREHKGKVRLTLVGREDEVRQEIAALHAESLPIDVLHAPDSVSMAEAPVRAAVRKKRSSLNVLANMQAQGDIQAMISAGNTGAVVASAQLALGKLEGVNKPAIASFLPTVRGTSIVLDVGATPDCKAMDLLQFAVMGSLYANHVLRLSRPRIGLLSIGEEPEKGNEVTRSAHRLLQQSSLDFVGNLEGRDVLQGKADVVVCDGFVGNIVLKFTEGALAFMAGRVRNEVRNSIPGRFGTWLLKPAMLRLRRSLDPEVMGGAPLLGLNGVCIVAHGRSGPKAICNAITMAVRYVQQGVNEHIRRELARIPSGDSMMEKKVVPCP